MSNTSVALANSGTDTQDVTKGALVTTASGADTNKMTIGIMDTAVIGADTSDLANRSPRATERQIYDALYLISQESVSLSTRKIAKITGLRREKFAALHKEYVLAKLLSADVKRIVDIVLGSYNTSSLPLEYHFAALVIQELLDIQKFEHARFFLCLDANFLKFINIHYSKLCELTEKSIREKLEVISQKYKISFCQNKKIG